MTFLSEPKLLPIQVQALHARAYKTVPREISVATLYGKAEKVVHAAYEIQRCKSKQFYGYRYQVRKVKC